MPEGSLPLQPSIHKPGYYASSKPHRPEGRDGSTLRGYDGVWRRLRRSYLASAPICVFCEEQGRIIEATEVDHIRSIREAPELRLEWTNLQALCKRCHSRKTINELRTRQAAVTGEGG